MLEFEGFVRFFLLFVGGVGLVMLGVWMKGEVVVVDWEEEGMEGTLSRKGYLCIR